MGFSMIRNFSIFFSSTQRKVLFSLNSKEKLDFSNQISNQSPKAFAMDFDLCIEWAIFTETSSPKILFCSLECQRSAISVGQQTAMIVIFANRIVELPYIYRQK